MKTMRVLAAMVAGAAMFFAPALMAQDAPAPAPAPAPKEEKPVEKPAEKPKEGEKAPEGDKKEEPKTAPKEEESGFAKMFKGLGDVTGKVEAAEADFKTFLKNYAEMDKLTEGDEKFQALSNTSLKEAFDYMLKNEKYLAWAKEKGLDGEKYLRISMRIVTIHIKSSAKDSFKEAEKAIEEGIKQIEGMKDQMPAEDYKNALAEMEKAKKEMASMLKTIEALPGPTEAEAKLYEANKKEIAKAMGEGEGEEAEDGDKGEKEDGMGGK